MEKMIRSYNNISPCAHESNNAKLRGIVIELAEVIARARAFPFR
jgi:hypothetical protein